MNPSKIGAGLWLAIALLISTSAWAAQKASVKFYDPINVGATQIQPGDYTLQWEGNGPDVELSILNGKSVVAKVPARLVATTKAANGNTIETAQSSDGTQSLSAIKLRGKKYSFEIGTEAAQAQRTGSN